MLTIENFTDKQQYVIAEFIHRLWRVFAHESDTLIKPEAEALIKVFQEHHVPEAFVANLTISDCIDLLVSNTSLEVRDEIMGKYYSGNL
jgi:hypothetical protein